MPALTDGTTITPSTESPIASSSTPVAPISTQATSAKSAAPTTSVPSAFSSEAGANAVAKAQQTAAKLAPPAARTPVTLGNGSKVYFDTTGKAFDAATGGNAISNETIAAGKAVAPTNPGNPNPSSSGNQGNSENQSGASGNGSGGSSSSGNGSSSTQSSVSFINPDTGQEYTLNNPTPDQVKSFQDKGFQISEGTGDGTGIIPAPTTDPAVEAQQKAVSDAKASLDTATKKLNTFDVSNDPQLSSLLASITASWNGRIDQMQNYDSSRLAAINTLGIRNGSRYTGGAGGMFGSIITAEEMAAADRVSSLESKKQTALLNARSALEKQDWTQYVNQVNTAQKAYDSQVSQLKDLQATALKVSEDKQTAQRKAEEDYYTQVTKPIHDIATAAAKNGADANTVASISNAKDLGSAVSAAGDFLKTYQSGIVGEYQFYADQAKKAGQTPVDFNTYQTIDANRKAKAAASSGGPGLDMSTLTPAQQTKLRGSGFTDFNGTTQNLAMQLVTGSIAPSELSKRTTGTSSYSDILSAADKYSMATTGKHFNVAQADRDYKFANNNATQNTLNYLGSLVGSDNGSGTLSGGNLDELVKQSNNISRTTFPALNNTAAWARYSTGDPNIAAFQATATEVADQVAKILQGGSGGGGTSDAKLQQASNLFSTGFTKDQLLAVVNTLKPLLANRAKSMIGNNPYLSDYASQFGVDQNIPGALPNTSDSIIQGEKQAQDNIKSYVSSHSGSQATITNQIQSMEKTLGRPVTAAEFLQAFPEYASS